MSEIIAGKKDINNKIFLNYFKYQNPLFLVKDLISTEQDRNEKLVNNINDGLIDLRNSVNRKEIPENKNPEKEVKIVEIILAFNKQQKRKGIKMLYLNKCFKEYQQLLHK